MDAAPTETVADDYFAGAANEALANRDAYEQLTLLDYAATSLWQFAFSLFLLQGLDCTPFQLGLIIAGGFIFQVALELPTGAFADVFGHSTAIFASTVCSLTCALGYCGLTVVKQSLLPDSDASHIVLWVLAIELISALGVALQSGSLETWASSPIRRLQLRGWRSRPIPAVLTAKWYATLESRAKSRVAWGFLIGGVASYGILALLSIPALHLLIGLPSQAIDYVWTIPWLCASLVYMQYVRLAYRVWRSEGIDFRSFQVDHLRETSLRIWQQFQSGVSRISKVAIDYCLEPARIPGTSAEVGHDTESATGLEPSEIPGTSTVQPAEEGVQVNGRAFVGLVFQNAILYFGIFTVTVFWAPTCSHLVQAILPRASRADVYLILGLIWGLISSVMAIGNRFHQETPWRRRSGSLFIVMFLLYAAAFLGLYLSSASASLNNIGFGAVSIAVTLLCACKLLEGYCRPMMSILVSLVLPRSRTRASLISVESWARTLLSSGLFVIAGYVSQLDFSNVWLMAALVMLIAAVATLAAMYCRSAIVATLVTGLGLCAVTYGWNCWLIAPVSATALKSHYQDELRYTVQRTTLELGDSHIHPTKVNTPVSLLLTSSTPWSTLGISVGKGVIRTEKCVADFTLVGDEYSGVYRFSLTSPANVILEAPASSSPDSYHAAVGEGHFLPLLIASISTLDWITAGVIVGAATCLFLFVVSTFLRNMRGELAVANQLGRFRERMARRWQSPEAATAPAGNGTSIPPDPRNEPWSDIHDLLKSIDIVSFGVASTMPGFRTAIRQEGTLERKYRVVHHYRLDGPHRNSVPPASPTESIPGGSEDIIAMTDNQFAATTENQAASRLTTVDLQPFASLLPVTTGADSAAEVYVYPLFTRYGTRDGGLRGIAYFVQRSPFGITAHEHYTIEAIAQMLDRWELEFFRHTLLWHDEVARAEARLAEIIYQLRDFDGYELPSGEVHFASSPDVLDENDGLSRAWGTDRLQLIGALRMLYRLRMDQTRLYQEPSSSAHAWIRAVEFPEFISVCTRAAVAEYLARSDSLPTTRQTHPFVQITSTGRPSSLSDCRFPLVYVWQAVENLLVNALVHAADDGSAMDGHPIKCNVELTWNRLGTELRIVIVSSRRGIPRTLWERYVVSGRVPAGNDRKGLWIAAHCAERAGGELQALNDSADYVTPCLVLKWEPRGSSS